ncbi:MAG: two-component regulator propeller domain-containing protein [Bacteroidota bacterium]
MIQKYSYIIWGLLASVSMLQAQESLLIQQLDRTDGLSQNSVIAIAQDEEGYMWFGTRDGLNKYDGYRFTVFRKDLLPSGNALLSNDIRELYYDPFTHQLWIGTPEGVSSYNIYTHQFTNYLVDNDHNEAYLVNKILRDQAKNLWLATPKGLFLLDESSKTTQHIPLSKSLDNVRSIRQDSDGYLWIGTTKGLFLLKQKTRKFVKEENIERYDPSLFVLKDLHIKTIEIDQDENVWFGTARNGVFRYDKQAKKVSNFRHDPNDPNSLSYDDARTIISAPNGDIYIGTLLGINRFDQARQQLYPLKLEQKNKSRQGLSNNSIHSLFFDKNDALWIGTYYGGVNYHDQRLKRFNVHQYKTEQNSINFNVVSSFMETQDGNLWIGTEGGGLNYLNRKTGIYSSFRHQENNPRSLSGNNVKILLRDEKGLWVGTFQNGLCYTENIENGFEVFRHQADDQRTPSHNNIYGLLKKGNTLWMATYGGGLNKMNIEDRRFEYFQSTPTDSLSLISNNCRLIFEDYAQNIWIGTDRGLDRMLMDEQGMATFQHYLRGVKIYSIAQVDKRGIWIGSSGNGLLYFDFANKTYSNPIQEETLRQGTIYGILVEKDQQNLWLSTSNGILKYNIQDETLNTYSAAYGLENLEYNFNAYYQDTQGQLYFGSTNGYINFSPKQIEDTIKYAPLVFTYLNAMGKRVEIKEKNGILQQDINHSSKVILDYNKANFSIGFAKLDYFNPKNNRYAYKMEGIDQAWIVAQKEVEATYTIQRPGTYTFRIKSYNNGGLGQEEERSIIFEVRPPWWKTSWAYLFYVLAILFLLLAIRQYYHLQTSYRLEQLSKQKQAEINEMKLRFFTNITHEFRTPLTLIISPLEDIIRYYKGKETQLDQLQLIKKNAKRLLSLVNQLLTFRVLESDHIQMKVGEGNIVPFVQEIFLTFKDKANQHQISYQFQSSEEEILLWFDRDKLEKVFYNLLSNAFKFTPDGQSITVAIKGGEKEVSILVKDTGVGIKKKDRPHIFKRFYEQSNTSAIQGSGIGLSMSKELVELHQGRITVESEHQKGAAFKVTLPLGRVHFKEEEVKVESLDDNNIESYTQLERETLFPISVEADGEKEILLIVEDNEDIAHYIYNIFSTRYQTIIASNGKAALQVIQNNLPDLIISDVMMPEIDGITFCQYIKSNLSTSHIPVVLLTARTAAIQELEGLKIGADDYITKPFDPELLRLKVANIISTRRKLHERIAISSSLNPKVVELPSKDKAFLQQVLDLMEKNIENPKFDVEFFAQELTLSRSILYKKIKALTNETPKSLMKQMRLKKAAQLLASQQLKVSEVAYQVGFGDPKYFAKCFREKYGCRPSDYEEVS